MNKTCGWIILLGISIISIGTYTPIQAQNDPFLFSNIGYLCMGQLELDFTGNVPRDQEQQSPLWQNKRVRGHCGIPTLSSSLLGEPLLEVGTRNESEGLVLAASSLPTMKSLQRAIEQLKNNGWSLDEKSELVRTRDNTFPSVSLKKDYWTIELSAVAKSFSGSLLLAVGFKEKQ